MVLGKDLMATYNLILEREGYWNGYDDKVDPSLPAAFASAAFRFGHSLLPSTVERWSVNHKYIGMMTSPAALIISNKPDESMNLIIIIYSIIIH